MVILTQNILVFKELKLSYLEKFGQIEDILVLGSRDLRFYYITTQLFIQLFYFNVWLENDGVGRWGNGEQQKKEDKNGKWRVTGLIPSQDTCLGCGPGPQ